MMEKVFFKLLVDIIVFLGAGLILFQIKHFLCDYPLQNAYMLKKFMPKVKDWVPSLGAHAGVHFIGTFLIGAALGVSFFGSLLGGFADFVVHFIVDRIKASPNLLGRFQTISKGEFKGLLDSKTMCLAGLKVTERPELVEECQRQLEVIEGRFKSNTYFWWALGWDQMMHHLTHYVILFFFLYIYLFGF